MNILAHAGALTAQTWGGQELVRVGDSVRVEGTPESLEGVQVVGSVHASTRAHFVPPHPVLAGDGPAVFDAQAEDGAGDLLGPLGRTGFGVVEQHQWVEIAIPGVEDVGP